jgi:hypothetical protein
MCRWKDNSEVDLQELDCKCAEWIDLAQDRSHSGFCERSNEQWVP